MPSAACDWSSDVCSTSEEHTSELQPHSEISYAVFCLKKKNLGPDGLVVELSTIRRSFPKIGGREGRVDVIVSLYVFFFFFNDTATTEIYTNLNTLSLHDALPISWCSITLRRVICKTP